MNSSAGGPPLLGRAAELAAASAVLTRITTDPDAGSALLLGGDAGVGKTRLVRALVEAASGLRVLVGHCTDFGGTGLPYLPFTEISGRLSASEPARADELARTFPAITRLRPSRRALASPIADDDGAPVRSDPTDGANATDRADADPALPERAALLDRAALFDDVLHAFGALAADRPTVIVVEDAHWADRSTRDLLTYLLTRLPPRLAIVVSYRTDDLHRRHPLRPAVAAWARLPQVERIVLDPLLPAAVRELIGYLHPAPLSERAIADIVDRAEGNPFFVGELATEIGDGLGDRPSGLPRGLVDTLLLRLDALDEPARTVVGAAAIAGRRVRHELLSAVMAESADGPAGLEAGLRAAIDANVLEIGQAADGTPEYGFRHALLAEAVFDDLLPGERMALHAAYARALRALGTLGTATELARHARAAGDLPLALIAEQQAAAEALQVAAPDEALAHYESALTINARLPPAEQADHVDLLHRASTVASAAGHSRRALVLAREAVASSPLPSHPTDADRERRAELLIAVASLLLAADKDADALAMTEQAVELVRTVPASAARARVSAIHAHALLGVRHGADALEWVRETERLAEVLDRPDLAVDVRTTAAWVTRYAGDPQRAAGELEVALAAAREVGDERAELRSRNGIGSIRFHQLGDLPGALAALNENVARAEALGRSWSVYALESRSLAALTSYALGLWTDGDRLCDLLGDRPPPDAAATMQATRLYSLAGRGDPDVEHALERVPWRSDGWLAMRAVPPVVIGRILAGRAADALDLLDELLPIAIELWGEEWFSARVRLSALALEALAAQADRGTDAERRAAADLARTWYVGGERTAETTQEQYGPFGPDGRAQLAVLRAQWARVRWSAGVDAPAAAELVDLWQGATDAFDGGEVLEQARARMYLAQALRVTGRPDDAAAELATVREVAMQLGAAPLLAAAGGGRGAAGGGGARHTPAALTDRERDVFALVAKGRSNRQIATALFISEKTVSVHVSNILGKLGVRSRTEAAALARREGWQPEPLGKA